MGAKAKVMGAKAKVMEAKAKVMGAAVIRALKPAAVILVVRVAELTLQVVGLEVVRTCH